MNRSTFALFVALLLHLFFMLLFWLLGSMLPEIKKVKDLNENKIKISLKKLPKIKKIVPRPIKETPKKIKIAPPMIKGSQLKKIIKKTPLKYNSKTKTLIPKLNHKPIKKIDKNIFIPIMKERKEVIQKETQLVKKKESKMDWLYENKAKFEKPTKKTKYSTNTNIGKSIKELYGSKFGELSQVQQEYILDNQEIMRRITQQVLTRQASVSNLKGLNVNKMNIIEFYLHPNGNKSDFRFLQKSGYFILDDITQETIEYAYSKYPRPKEKTLIRYNVFYNLAGH